MAPGNPCTPSRRRRRTSPCRVCSAVRRCSGGSGLARYGTPRPPVRAIWRGQLRAYPRRFACLHRCLPGNTRTADPGTTARSQWLLLYLVILERYARLSAGISSVLPLPPSCSMVRIDGSILACVGGQRLRAEDAVAARVSGSFCELGVKEFAYGCRLGFREMKGYRLVCCPSLTDIK